MKQLAITLLNLAKTFMPRPTNPVTPTQNLHWTKFDKPFDQMTYEERKASADHLARQALETFNKTDK